MPENVTQTSEQEVQSTAQPETQPAPSEEPTVPSEGRKPEEPPAWLASLEERLIRESRRAQSQATQAERRVEALEQFLLSQTQQGARTPQDRGISLDDIDDPNVKAVAGLVQDMIAEQKREKAEREREKRERETKEATDRYRQYTLGELKDRAEEDGVDFSKIESQLKEITDSGELWQEGKKLIRAAKKTPSSQIKKEEQRKQEQETGMYQEQRSGTTSRVARTKQQLQEQYGSGAINSEAYAAGMRALGLEP